MNEEKLLKCKLCQYQSRQLHQHLKHVHNISCQEYRNIYGENQVMTIGHKPPTRIKNKINNYLYCSICGYESKYLGYHIKIQHGITIEDYKLKFPNDKLRLVDGKNSSFKHGNKNITSLQNTKKLLNEINLEEYEGRTGPLKMYRQNATLYNSILHYTKYMDELINLTLIKRIEHIMENKSKSDYKCKCGQTYTLNKYCRKCKPSYPSYQWFKEFNTKDGTKEQYVEFKKSFLENSTNIQGFAKKYGQSAMEEYLKYWQNIFKSRNNIKYSLKSQKLFDMLLCNIDCKDVFYATFNKQWKIYLNKEQSLLAGQTVFCLDFVRKNKIIQFDGTYWHSKRKQQDSIRDQILIKMGFQILRIDQNQFDLNESQTVKKCLEFLK